jgi:mannose-binding lectin 2
LLGVEQTAGDLIPALSFGPPYSALKVDGTRTLENWQHGGDANVHKSFVRLTSDRQSKQGYVWSQQAIQSEDMSAILQFRVSGQGARFFGDGIALWMTQTKHYSGGTLHGAPDKFTGIGIILDTFKNTENAATHKDVMVLINDGQKSVEEMQKSAFGCDSAFRYHEKRADFSVTNSSRLKITYNNQKLDVFIDPRSTGVWEACTSIPNLGLPNGWAQTAQFGISSSTGALADNHDVVSFNTFSASNDVQVMAHDDTTVAMAKPIEERHAGDEISKLRAEIQLLREELEHKLEAVDDGLKHSLKKLQAQENKAEERIAVLESEIHARVADHVDSKTKAITDSLGSTVAAQMHSVRSDMQQGIKNHIATAGSGTAWKMPFFLLCLVLGGLSFFVHRKWVELRKQHLL